MKPSSKKLIIFGVIIINLLGAWSFYYMFYGKRNSFDLDKKVSINSSKITKIETDLGTWKWHDTVFDFYHDYKVILKDRDGIKAFCEILKSSKPKYIDTRAVEWIDIYLDKVDLNPEIKLQQTNSNEIFFEFDNHTYEGKELSEFIKKNKIKVK
ncbi:hypothetical protein GCM10022389_18480 [Flavobacterium cheonanense]|uniref:Uncharacterized protein n=1 Tax=Flavobacterium cheonanense TaxID=706183 RepID=A0ABP7VT32_9FLAO